MKMKLLPFILGLVILAGCFSGRPGHTTDGSGSEKGWHEISQEEAKKMMEQDDGHVIVDVREWEEYNSGFIPGAVCVPLGTITETAPVRLPDREQVILVYCRSGNRSKQAAAKLADMGYKNIYEFGGISTWTGTLDHSNEGFMDPMPIYCLRISDSHFTFIPAENETAEAFLEQLDRGPLDIVLTDLDETGRSGTISWSLPGKAETMEYEAGDILFDGKDRIVICTGSGSGTWIKLAETDRMYLEELPEALAGEQAEASFFIEWTE